MPDCHQPDMVPVGPIKVHYRFKLNAENIHMCEHQRQKTYLRRRFRSATAFSQSNLNLHLANFWIVSQFKVSWCGQRSLWSAQSDQSLCCPPVSEATLDPGLPTMPCENCADWYESICTCKLVGRHRFFLFSFLYEDVLESDYDHLSKF